MCDCFKRKVSDLARMRELAEKLVKADNTDYVIYTENGRIYTDRRECWEKSGKPGQLREIVFNIP